MTGISRMPINTDAQVQVQGQWPLRLAGTGLYQATGGPRRGGKHNVCTLHWDSNSELASR